MLMPARIGARVYVPVSLFLNGAIRMDAERFANEMLAADPMIRYVAVISYDYRILAARQRELVPALASDEVQNNYASIIPRIMAEAVGKLSPYLGKVTGITAHYEKALLVLYPLESAIVLVSFQPEVAAPFYNRITEKFKLLSSKFLN